MRTQTYVATRGTARQRILDTAYELFSRRGIRDVGVEEIFERSGVTKASFYRHVQSKDTLVLAFLADREKRWTLGLVRNGAWRRGHDSPETQLVAIFDVFDEWFRDRAAFDGCSFINVLLEMGPDHPAGRAAIDHLAHIRQLVREWAEQAGLRDPEEFAHAWHILMKGSIIAAAEGDKQAARRAQDMARRLIDDHRSPPDSDRDAAPANTD